LIRRFSLIYITSIILPPVVVALVIDDFEPGAMIENAASPANIIIAHADSEQAQAFSALLSSRFSG